MRKKRQAKETGCETTGKKLVSRRDFMKTTGVALWPQRPAPRFCRSIRSRSGATYG